LERKIFSKQRTIYKEKEKKQNLAAKKGREGHYADQGGASSVVIER